MAYGTVHKIDLPPHWDQDTTRHSLDQGGGFFTHSELHVHIMVDQLSGQSEPSNIQELGRVKDLPIKLLPGKLPGPWVTGLDGAWEPWRKAGGGNQ